MERGTAPEAFHQVKFVEVVLTGLTQPEGTPDKESLLLLLTWLIEVLMESGVGTYGTP